MTSDLAPDQRARVAAAAVARLATVRPDDSPHLVVVTFALEDDRLVTAIDHKPKSTHDLQRLRNVAANPAVSVLVDHYEEDWSRLWWARGDGQAHVVADGPEYDRAVALLVAKYGQYREQRPAGPAIIVDISRWTTWSAA